jgi:Domain of unknown function (DUF4333)
MTEPPRDDEVPEQQPYARPRPYPEGRGPAAYAAEETPAQKSSARVALAVAGGVVLLLTLVVMVLVMTLGSTVLDPAAVERDVAVQFEELEGVGIDLDCPTDMRVESGAEYTCTGTTAEGEEVVLAIRITDPPDDAEYTWTEVRN